MEKTQKKCKFNIIFFLVVLGLVLVAVVLSIRLSEKPDKVEEKIITSATLKDAIDISELSSAQFTDNGIAKIYKNEKKKKVECYVKYNAQVKAGIDMKDIDFEIDEEAKTIKPILPEIKISSNPVDEKTLSFIPSDTKVELDVVLKSCKEDAEREAMESSGLIETAENNLKSIIEGLLRPIVAPEGYDIIW